MSIPETVAEMKRHFPRRIPRAFAKEADSSVTNYIFAYDKADRQKGICSACGKQIVIDACYMHHNDWTCCPKCGRSGEVKHIGRFKYLSSTTLSYHYAHSRLDPDVLTCMVVYSHYDYSGPTPWLNKPARAIDALYVFAPGGTAYASGNVKWPEDMNDERMWMRKKCLVRHKAYTSISVVPGLCLQSIDDIDREIMKTGLRYAWAAYKEKNSELRCREYNAHLPYLLEAIAKWTMQMELLAKLGFSHVIMETVLCGKGINGVFHMNGTTKNAVLRGPISKAELRYFWEHDVDMDTLWLWQKLRHTEKNRSITLNEVDSIYRRNADKMWHIDRNQMAHLMQYVRFGKLMEYISMQQKRAEGYIRINLGTYADYIADCERLGADMSSKTVLFPKDLHEIHLLTSERVQHKINEIKAQKYEKIRQKLLKKYTFETKGFKIVVPDKIEDLIREGTDMHNCVGGYTDRVLDEKTDVIYIRKAAKPNVSFGTMEIRQGKIIQARGKYNKDLPKDAAEFVEQFRTEVLEKTQKAKRRKTV